MGIWYAPCCAQDLRQINTQEELKEALESSKEMGGQFYATLEDALKVECPVAHDAIMAQKELINTLYRSLDKAEARLERAWAKLTALTE